MNLELRPIHPEFAAEVAELDAGRPLDAATVRALWQAIDRYPVLVLRDQRLDDNRLKAFAARFGPLEIGRAALQPGRRRLGIPEIGDISNLDEDGRIRARDDRRRLEVRRHSATGRKTLYLSAHASHISGWPVPEGRLLLHDLTEHATGRGFVYSHKWREGDLVIWDNRVTMHRGRPHDESAPRDLRRATTLDRGSSLDEAA